MKRKSRPLTSINGFQRLDRKHFEITYTEKKKPKKLVYQCKTADNCSEIVAKLSFLIVRASFVTHIF